MEQLETGCKGAEASEYGLLFYRKLLGGIDPQSSSDTSLMWNILSAFGHQSPLSYIYPTFYLFVSGKHLVYVRMWTISACWFYTFYMFWIKEEAVCVFT